MIYGRVTNPYPRLGTKWELFLKSIITDVVFLLIVLIKVVPTHCVGTCLSMELQIKSQITNTGIQMILNLYD